MSPSEFVYTVLLRPRPLRKLANAAIRGVLPRAVSVHGARIMLNPHDPVVSGALAMGVYEKEEIAFFQRHFRPGMTFVDVGANVGLYSGMALATSGFSGTVLCVEPDADSRGFLKQTLEANGLGGRGRVVVCPVAASDRAESVPFYRNPENHGDNRLYSEAMLQPAGTVETETLDTLCAKNGIAAIDFLKIDVQGAEGRVLAGARKILQASPNVVLMTEFWPYGLTRCGSDPEVYLKTLESLGFSLGDSTGNPLSAAGRKELIDRTSGRKYTNLFGFKGDRSPVP